MAFCSLKRSMYGVFLLSVTQIVVFVILALSTDIFSLTTFLYSQSRMVHILKFSVICACITFLLQLCSTLLSKPRFVKFSIFIYSTELITSLLFLAISVNTRLQATTFLPQICQTTQFPPTFVALSKFEPYDSIFQNVGLPDYLCGQNCECALPTPQFNYAYSRFDDMTKIISHRTITSGANLNTKTQHCPFYESKYSRAERSLIDVMGKLEKQYSCSGICFTSNLSVASDSQKIEVKEQFDKRRGSCREKLIEQIQTYFNWQICLFSGFSSIFGFYILVNVTVLKSLNQQTQEEQREKLASKMD